MIDTQVKFALNVGICDLLKHIQKNISQCLTP